MLPDKDNNAQGAETVKRNNAPGAGNCILFASGAKCATFPAMPDFSQKLSRFTVDQITLAVGCSQRAAYDWLKGKKQPPAWLQPGILEKLAAIPPAPRPPASQRRGVGRPRKYGA